MIDIGKAACCRQRAIREELRRDLRGDDVHHVEAHRLLPIGGSEGRLPRGAIDRDQIAAKRQIDAVFPDIFHQRRDIIRHPEQHRARVAELDFDIAQHAPAPPVVAGEIHRLLRRARTFDRHRRLRENRPPLLQSLHQLPGVGRQIGAIIRGDAVCAKGRFQPRDLLPRQPDAGGNDQHIIGQRAAIGERHLIVLGLETGAGLLHPAHALGHDACHGADGGGDIEHPAADHRPAGLVGMGVRRFDNRNVEPGTALQHRSRRGDPARAAADDHNRVLVCAHVPSLPWRT